MQARLSRQRLGWKPCLGESNAASTHQAQAFLKEALLFLIRVDLYTRGLQPSCTQSRLAQNQNCFRLGHGTFSEVPFSEDRLVTAKSELDLQTTGL